MNNLKKLGLSALASSLVAVSVQAGEMAVTGSANVTYKTGKTQSSGKSIGTDKDVAFTGTGELDNGYTFVVSTLLTDAYSVSSSYTSMTLGSLGTLTAGADFGGASYKYDEEIPQAYEQTSDAQQNSANIVGNVMDNNSIVYNSPAFEFEGATISFDAEYAFNASGNSANDGGQAAVNDSIGQGMGLGVTAKYEGGVFGIYANERDRTAPASSLQRAPFEGVWYAKYSMGPVSVGYSQSYLDSGEVTTVEAATATKGIRTAGGLFESESMSIAFNVNDDLSVSYTETEDVYDAQDNAAAAIADVTQTSEALQIAYSMGAMSVKAYQMETSNPGYSTTAPSKSVTEIALGLSF